MTRSQRYPRSVVPLALAMTSIALAQPALADDTPLVATVPDVAETQPLLDTRVTTSSDEPAPRYPRSVIARPLTLPSGVAVLGGDAVANKDFSTLGGAPTVGFGITDKLEVQMPYAFTARELEPRGSLGVDVGYAVIRGALDGKLEAVARVRGGYNTLDTQVTPLMVGLHVQYNVKPWLALISGVPGAQQLRIGVEEDATMAKPVDVALPIGIGVQPTTELYLQLDTRLAQLAIADSEHALVGKDMTPIALTIVYNVINALDVQAAVATDITNAPGDSLSFLVGARYYAGHL